MATNNTTFWNLINTYKISIPIIQRDYAQGREEESEKREKFLNAILKHLTYNEKQHLDFVYGRVKENTFFPIDGQQRLTTLFLLHWYFALKEKEKVSNEEKLKLSQFVYNTRISSREFCQCLINEIIEIPAKTGDKIFITEIKNKHWYRDKWDTDPTVKAMLIMIQDIHNKFYSISSSSVFAQLVNTNSISFELLDLGKKGFELTDELYIKMNARGKQLTSFESFKANFIQLIDKHFKNKKLKHPIKGEISYSGYFSYKVEKEWTDLFWSFRGDKKTTDDGFSNYFEFITQLFYFKKHRDKKAEDFTNSFSQYEEVFSIEENLLFLYDSLDALYKIFTKSGNGLKLNIDQFYEDLLLLENEQIDGTSNIRLFWNKQNEYNLFELLIKNNETEDVSNKRRNWIIQFCILQHLVKFEKNEVDETLRNYVRILRNLFQATRYKSDTKFINDIRLNYFSDYFTVFDKLNTKDPYSTLINEEIPFKGSRFTENTIKNEIEKTKILYNNTDNSIKKALIGLENFKFFEGLIHQLKPNELSKNYPDYLNSIKAIYDDSISSSLKVRALIACGFEGVYTKNCRMGEMWYFGKNRNWSFILTNEDPKVSECLIKLLVNYLYFQGDPEERLRLIIDKWLINNIKDRSWRYYFIKYPEFTSKLNYYVWPNDFEIRILGSEGSNPLVAYHINPYVLTVCRNINNKSVCEEEQCYLQYSGNSPLFLKNGILMYSTKDGWKIPVNQIISDAMISKYSLALINDNYLLKDNSEKDRIEIAIDFINDIYKP